MISNRVLSLYGLYGAIGTPYSTVQISGTKPYRTGQLPYRKRTECVQAVRWLSVSCTDAQYLPSRVERSFQRIGNRVIDRHRNLNEINVLLATQSLHSGIILVMHYHKVIGLYAMQINYLCYYVIERVPLMYQLRPKNMTTESTAIEPPQTQFSSGMQAGRLQGVDGRTWAARRYRELVGAMASDLGGDLTAACTAIVCRAATLVTWCEQQESEFAKTGEMDVAQFTTATNTLRRLLSDIGLERKAKDVPSLQQYLQNREATP